MKIMHEINDVINLLITYMFDMLTGSVSNKFLVLQKKKIPEILQYFEEIIYVYRISYIVVIFYK